jgi:hypothetical protein
MMKSRLTDPDRLLEDDAQAAGHIKRALSRLYSSPVYHGRDAVTIVPFIIKW